MSDECRAAFEKWAVSERYVVSTYADDGSYMGKEMSTNWMVWQAAWNTQRGTITKGNTITIPHESEWNSETDYLALCEMKDIGNRGAYVIGDIIKRIMRMDT